MRRATVVVAFAQLACSAAVDPPDIPGPAELAQPAVHHAELQLIFRGRPIGLVRERLVASADGYRFERSETWRARRDHVLVEGAVRTTIDTDRQLRARRIVFESTGEQQSRAERHNGDWLIERPGQPVRRVTGSAQPIELLHLQMQHDQRDQHSGPVLLPGLSFALAHAEVRSIDPSTRLLLLSGRGLSAQRRIELAADGSVARVVGPDITAIARARPPEDTSDLITDSSIAVGGRPGPTLELALDRPSPIPPALGHMAQAAHSSWRIDLTGAAVSVPVIDSAAEPDPPLSPAAIELANRLPRGAAELTELAARTAELIDDDLRSGPASSSQILARRRGDCVAHSLVFAELARARGYQAHLVTGLVLDGTRLIRHAWVQVDGPEGALAFDPTTGEAPIVEPGHIPLAVHGSAPSEIALAAELAYAPLAKARARFIDPPTVPSTVRSP